MKLRLWSSTILFAVLLGFVLWAKGAASGTPLAYTLAVAQCLLLALTTFETVTLEALDSLTFRYLPTLVVVLLHALALTVSPWADVVVLLVMFFIMLVFSLFHPWERKRLFVAFLPILVVSNTTNVWVKDWSGAYIQDLALAVIAFHLASTWGVFSLEAAQTRNRQEKAAAELAKAHKAGASS